MAHIKESLNELLGEISTWKAAASSCPNYLQINILKDIRSSTKQLLSVTDVNTVLSKNDRVKLTTQLVAFLVDEWQHDEKQTTIDSVSSGVTWVPDGVLLLSCLVSRDASCQLIAAHSTLFSHFSAALTDSQSLSAPLRIAIVSCVAALCHRNEECQSKIRSSGLLRSLSRDFAHVMFTSEQLSMIPYYGRCFEACLSSGIPVSHTDKTPMDVVLFTTVRFICASLSTTNPDSSADQVDASAIIQMRDCFRLVQCLINDNVAFVDDLWREMIPRRLLQAALSVVSQAAEMDDRLIDICKCLKNSVQVFSCLTNDIGRLEASDELLAVLFSDDFSRLIGNSLSTAMHSIAVCVDAALALIVAVVHLTAGIVGQLNQFNESPAVDQLLCILSKEPMTEYWSDPSLKSAMLRLISCRLTACDSSVDSLHDDVLRRRLSDIVDASWDETEYSGCKVERWLAASSSSENNDNRQIDCIAAAAADAGCTGQSPRRSRSEASVLRRKRASSKRLSAADRRAFLDHLIRRRRRSRRRHHERSKKLAGAFDKDVTLKSSHFIMI